MIHLDRHTFGKKVGGEWKLRHTVSNDGAMTEKILAVIPARIGSKGIIKRTHPLKDKPLADWTISCVRFVFI
ncbi:MAG: hypothetical protein CM15mP19_00110 [Gammaproteobacteria bacterium]|nr:MAG: hypothetical protein CM15mP19_00110 [Gammaproteobacteria bacterium]